MARGQADGFGLDVLSRLRDVKGECRNFKIYF